MVDIGKNEHFKAQMIDIVDYEHKDYTNEDLDIDYKHPIDAAKKAGANVANEWGVKMQRIGRVKNVFHVVDIDIPVNELKIKD